MALGQRTKLTPELQDAICALIRDKGAYPSVAAVACGIAEATFYEWLARGRVNKSSNSSSTSPDGNGPGTAVEVTEPGTHGRGDPLGLYARFADAIKKAEADLEVEVVEDAKGKMKDSKSPLAPIIFLSRRFRERWAEQVTVAAAGKEAVASMERIKAAWDAPEVVDGEYREVPEGTRPQLVPGEASGTQNCSFANQSEASLDLGFHVPPPDLPDDPDAETDPDADAESEAEPESGVPTVNMRPPTSLSPPGSLEGTPVEGSKTKSEQENK